MHMSTKSLLALLTVFQFCLATPGGSKEEKQADEQEKMRLVYLRLHPEHNIAAAPYPRIPLHWRSLPTQATAVTKEQINQAQQAYDALQQDINALTAKRNTYLEKESSVYKELEALIDHLMDFRKNHQKKLEAVMKDCPYTQEIFDAQTKLAQAWCTLDQLQSTYEMEHQNPYHGPWDNFPMPTFPKEPSLAEVKQLAKKAPTIKVVPGQVLDDKTDPRLPALATPRGGVERSINRQVESYSLFELPTKRNPKCKRAMQFGMGMNYVSNNQSPMMMGGSTGTNYYTLTVGKDACPGSKICIIKNHVNGDHSVLFTLEVVAK